MLRTMMAQMSCAGRRQRKRWKCDLDIAEVAEIVK